MNDDLDNELAWLSTDELLEFAELRRRTTSLEQELALRLRLAVEMTSRPHGRLRGQPNSGSTGFTRRGVCRRRPRH